mgnify:CR=1 FL=1
MSVAAGEVSARDAGTDTEVPSRAWAGFLRAQRRVPVTVAEVARLKCSGALERGGEAVGLGVAFVVLLDELAEQLFA